MPGKVDELFWELDAETGPLEGSLAAATQAIRKFGALLTGPAGIAAGIATVTAGLGALGKQAIDAAAPLDKALREVATLMDRTRESLGTLRSEIIDLSTRVPEMPQQLTEGVYQAISAGAEGTAEALDIVEASSKAAVAGLTDTGTAVDAVTTVLNAYGKEAEQASAVTDVLFKTVEEGKIRFPELAQQVGRVANSAALAGASIEEVGAAIATMTARGVEASEAITSLNRLLLAAAKSTKDARQKAEELGIEWSVSAIKSKGLVGALRDVEQAAGGNLDVMTELFPRIRAVRGAAILAGKGADDFRASLEEMQQAQGAVAEAAAEMNDSLQNQVRMLKNQVRAEWLNLGQTLLEQVQPAISGLVEQMEDDLDRHVRNLKLAGAEQAAFLAEQGQQLKLLQDQIAETEEAISEDISGIQETLEARVEIQGGGRSLGRKSRQPGLALREQFPQLEQVQQMDFTELQKFTERFRQFVTAQQQAQGEARELTDLQLQAASEVLKNLEQLTQRQDVLLDMQLKRKNLRDEQIRRLNRQIAQEQRIRELAARQGEAGEEQVQRAEERIERLKQARAIRKAENKVAHLSNQLNREGIDSLEEAKQLRDALAQEAAKMASTDAKTAAEVDRQRQIANRLVGAYRELVTAKGAQRDVSEATTELSLEQVRIAKIQEQALRDRISALEQAGAEDRRRTELLRKQAQIAELGKLVAEERARIMQDQGGSMRTLLELQRQRARAQRELFALQKGMVTETVDAAEAQERATDAIREAMQVPERRQGFDFLQFDAAQRDQIISALNETRDEAERLRDAQAELETAKLLGDPEEIEAAKQEVNEAQRAMREAAQGLRDDLAKVIEDPEKLNKVMETITGQMQQADDSASGLVSTMEDIEGVARGVLNAADALGVLDQQARSAIRSAVDLASSIKNIAASGGLNIGSIAQAAGSLVGLVGGLIGGGPSEAEKARRENTRALRELKDSVEKMRDALNQVSGETFSQLQSLLGSLPTGRLSGGDLEGFFEQLDSMDLSRADLEQVAQALGITVDELTKLEEMNADKAAAQLEGLRSAVNSLDLEKALSGFRSQLDLLQTELELFDVEDPVERLRRTRDLLLEFTNLPDRFQRALQGADVSTAEGRRQLNEAIQAIFQALRSGQISPGAFGELTLDQMLNQLENIETTIDETEGAGEGSTTQFSRDRTITEVTGTRMISTLTTIAADQSKEVELTRDLLRAVTGGAMLSVPEETAGRATGITRVAELMERQVELQGQTWRELTEAEGGEEQMPPAEVTPDAMMRRLMQRVTAAQRQGLEPPTREQLDRAMAGMGETSVSLTIDQIGPFHLEGVDEPEDVEELAERLSSLVGERIADDLIDLLRQQGNRRLGLEGDSRPLSAS